MRRASILLGIPLILAPACSEAPTEVTATAESVMPAMSMGSRSILMRDACDPPSFNAAFGFEVCTPVHAQAGISFETFIAQLQRDGTVEAWRFAPSRIHVNRTTTFRVPNMGGIPHSFTEVAEFGGGFIPVLNALSGNPVPAPECVHPENPEAPHPDVALIAPGDEDHVMIEPGEGKKYMCCIHPWMRAVTH